MSTNDSGSDGFIPFRGFRTWYRIVGDAKKAAPGKFPVLAIHGSPLSHQSLEPLARIIDTGRSVIFYDQLGCGDSDQPEDQSIWSMELFIDQLATLREALDLNLVHLFGHSFGGMIALEYMFTKPSGIVSLTLHSTPASYPLFGVEWDRLRSELPLDVQETLAKHEAGGTIDDPAYQKAREVFDHRHIWRLDPLPDYLLRALENLQVAKFDLDEWDVRSRLEEIEISTLITSGKYDIVTPMLAEILRDGIAGSEWVIFKESSHYAHAEEPDHFLSIMDGFLTRVEQREVLSD
jgi:proline-specific peptidase